MNRPDNQEAVMAFDDESWFEGRLREIDEEECWELLEPRPVGRIAYVDEQGPIVLPVNFVLVDRTVIFRVSAYSVLGRNLPGAAAAFQADEIDEYTRSAWSVLVRGRVEIADTDDLPKEARPRPWVEGPRTLFLRLVPTQVSGRRLLAA